MTPEDFETAYLSLYGPDERRIDTASGRDIAELSYIPEVSRTHYIRASELGDDDTGDYSILAEKAMIEDDHGDDPGSATSIALNERTTGTIEVVSDKDFFAIDLEAGQRYLFQMTPEDFETAYLSLYGPDERRIDTASGRDIAELSYIPEVSRTHYIRASELGDDDTGDYSILAEKAMIEDDHGDDPGSATSIALNERTTGTIEVVSDKDFFAIDLEAGQRYLFQMTPGDLDIAYLWLYGPDERRIDAASGRDIAELSYIPEVSRTHYIRASELGDDDTGDYSILAEKITIEDDHPDRPNGANINSTHNVVDGYLMENIELVGMGLTTIV